MKSEKQGKAAPLVLWPAFILYLSVVFLLIIGKSWGGFSYIAQCYADLDSWKQEIMWNLNVIPFRFLFHIQGYTPITWCKNVIGNIVLFVPMGFFLLFLFPKVRAWRFKKYIFIMASAIICIELFQLFFMCGHCDIDDLILNLFGASLGFLLTKRVLKPGGPLND